MSGFDPVPHRVLGGVPVPALFLGDNGFLSKLGSVRSDAEVTALMSYAVGLMGVGLAGGDERCLSAARTVSDATDAAEPVRVMHHTDVAVELDGSPLRYRRCAATLRQHLRTQGILVASDPILRFLDEFAEVPPLSRSEVERLRIGIPGQEATRRLVAQHRPDVVTVGGDYLDMLLLLGRVDLAETGLTSLITSPTSPQSRPVMLATLYVGALVPERAKGVLDIVDGIMAPLNRHGAAMLPDADTALRWLRSAGPLVAMHVRAGGLDDTAAGLTHAEAFGVAASVIGASRCSTINALAADARAVFGTETVPSEGSPR